MPHRVRESNAAAASYPTWVGFIFIFNLIVGTGALTLPGVFARAGWLLSLIVVVLLAFISYMTVTFVIEVMACMNAVKSWQNLQLQYESEGNTDADDDADDETATLIQPAVDSSATAIPPATRSIPEYTTLYTERHSYSLYNLTEKFELGEMAVLFFNDLGRMLFYLCIAIYLYGDLSIYSAAIAKSLRDIACDKGNGTVPGDLTSAALMDKNNNTDPYATCWSNHTLTRLSVYRLFLIGFTLLFGPFVAFSVQKTKYFQILTVVFRWLAFTLMIGIALKLLISEGVKGHPVAMNIYGLPSLFGACVYSFMCHHSLPSLLAPIRNKLALRTILSYDYMLICLFYILLAMTGIFAFAHLEDLYTLNFIPAQSDDRTFRTELLIVIDYFLALFPVFTLSASFPIIAITLRNNLQSLFLDMTRFETYNYFVRRILFPLCAVVPPFVITYFTENLSSLVAFTGSYAGAAIQYLIPVSLIYFARKTCTDLLGNGLVNDFQSPFRSKYWLLFVLVWALFCMTLVTANFFLSTKS